MRAILLAAGQGQRLRPFTEDRPKCMVEFEGKPLLDWQIAALRAAGVEDLVVVRGYQRGAIQRPGLRFYDNERWAHTHMVQSLCAALPELRGDVLIAYTDLLYRPAIVRRLIASQADIAVAVDRQWRALWERRMENPLADAETLKLGPSNLITEIGGKPSRYDEIEGQYIGLIRLSPRGCERVIDALARAARSEAEGQPAIGSKSLDSAHMTDLLQHLIEHGMPVRGVLIEGGWCEIDTPRDLQVAGELLREGALGRIPLAGVA